MNDDTISAMEMAEFATGLFRRSFTEAMIDGYTFYIKIKNGKQ